MLGSKETLWNLTLACPNAPEPLLRLALGDTREIPKDLLWGRDKHVYVHKLSLFITHPNSSEEIKAVALRRLADLRDEDGEEGSSGTTTVHDTAQKLGSIEDFDGSLTKHAIKKDSSLGVLLAILTNPTVPNQTCFKIAKMLLTSPTLKDSHLAAVKRVTRRRLGLAQKLLKDPKVTNPVAQKMLTSVVVEQATKGPMPLEGYKSKDILAWLNTNPKESDVATWVQELGDKTSTLIVLKHYRDLTGLVATEALKVANRTTGDARSELAGHILGTPGIAPEVGKSAVLLIDWNPSSNHERYRNCFGPDELYGRTHYWALVRSDVTLASKVIERSAPWMGYDLMDMPGLSRGALLRLLDSFKRYDNPYYRAILVAYLMTHQTLPPILYDKALKFMEVPEPAKAPTYNHFYRYNENRFLVTERLSSERAEKRPAEVVGNFTPKDLVNYDGQMSSEQTRRLLVGLDRLFVRTEKAAHGPSTWVTVVSLMDSWTGKFSDLLKASCDAAA